MYQLTLIRSRRKSLAIQVLSSNRVVVRAPAGLPEKDINAFLLSRQAWIALHLQKAAQREAEKRAVVPFTEQELDAMAARARTVMPALCARYAAKMGVRYQRIAIRRQRTRWGSCSRQGNLNFNCLLMGCPPSVQEYVAVHELCHLKEMNHSPRFWQAVRQVLPDCEQARRWLKTEGQKLIERLP